MVKIEYGLNLNVTTSYYHTVKIEFKNTCRKNASEIDAGFAPVIISDRT